jgi:chromosome partitioning protein
LGQSHRFIVIDTPGHDSDLMRRAHSMADTLITPLNDSFVDLDVLGTVDPETLGITGTSHYAGMVEEARRQRQLLDHVTADWIVLRNRLSTLGSRNKRLVGEGLQELSRRLNFRCIEGLAERVIFREFYPRGLTAVDDLEEITLGTRPTMSHVTARLEIENLLSAMGLADSMTSDEMMGHARDAA